METPPAAVGVAGGAPPATVVMVYCWASATVAQPSTKKVFNMDNLNLCSHRLRHRFQSARTRFTIHVAVSDSSHLALVDRIHQHSAGSEARADFGGCKAGPA